MGAKIELYSRKRNRNEVLGRRLPRETAVELLEHMSEEGRFEQTLSQFPNMNLQELRHTFAWLAEEMRRRKREDASRNEDCRRIVAKMAEDSRMSETTKKVLTQLPPEAGLALLQSFGAVDESL